MKTSDYMKKIDAMEEAHLDWLSRFRPRRVTAEIAADYPAGKVWRAGYFGKTGEYLIFTGQGPIDWNPEAHFISEVEVSPTGGEFILYRDEAPCLECNSAYDDDKEDSESLDPSCENCEGSGWAVFDCINMPEYEALVNELESEEDEDFCEYLGIYVEENS